MIGGVASVDSAVLGECPASVVGGYGGSGNVVSVIWCCKVLGPVSSGEFGESADVASESKIAVDAGSTGHFSVGKLSSALVSLVVKFKAVDHLPMMSILYSGAALTVGMMPIAVDAFGSTLGVSEGRGSGYEPSWYA